MEKGEPRGRRKRVADEPKKEVSRKKETKTKPLGSGSSSENHGILWVPGKGFERANYMGPGTDLFGRLERKDQGKTAIDQISKLHDIDYTLASGLARDEKEQGDLGRAADERMIRNGWKAFKEGKENAFNFVEGAGLIKAKNFLEDWGIISKTKFLGPRTFKYMLGAENRDTSEYEVLLRARQELVCGEEQVTADKGDCEETERELNKL